MKYFVFYSVFIFRSLSFLYGQNTVDTIDIKEIHYFKSLTSGMNFPLISSNEKLLTEINLDLRERILENRNFIDEQNIQLIALLDSFCYAGVGLIYELFSNDSLISLEFYGLNNWGIYEFHNYSLISKKHLELADLLNKNEMFLINDSINNLKKSERKEVVAHFNKKCIDDSRHSWQQSEVLDYLDSSKISGFFVNDSSIVIYLDKWHDNFEIVEMYPIMFDFYDLEID